MPDTIESTVAPTQDISRTPTLLESLASSGADLASTPRISAKQLPPIGTEPNTKSAKPEEKKAEATKPAKEEPQIEPEKKEEPSKESAEGLQKSASAIADKLFGKRTRTSKEADKVVGVPAGTEEEKTTPEQPPVKPSESKPKEEKPKPSARRPVPPAHLDEAAITERAAAAAAKAVSDTISKTSQKQPDQLEKGPEDNLSTAERKQFVVYKELEELDPSRYKGVSEKYIKSLSEISDYVKTWSKDNPGTRFDPEDKEHNAFFERVEPEVDEDDWVDAKANIRARDIAARAIAPVNERMQQMERDRARTALEPVLQSKQIEATHLLLEHFDPAVAEAIRKPDGLKELTSKDPITVAVLTAVTDAVGMLAAEVVRLHDPMGGVEYNASNPAHKEIADFIVGQEKRIASLPTEDRERDGRQFMSRLKFQQLSPEEKSRYWFLNQDDVIDLLAQKYALQAKKLRDSRVEEFNKQAESLGFKKIDVAKEAPKTTPTTPKDTPKPKDTPPSPEATSRASTKPTPGSTVTPATSPESAIVGALFSRYRSA